MFWGIDRPEWLILWSGVLGAAVSAAVAALVAMTVLSRSSAHQQKLAAEGIARQKELAAEQLAEQRAEAALSRERAALADVIIAAEGLVFVARDSNEEVRSYIPTLQAAIARWRVELGAGSMQMELMRWSALLVDSAHIMAAARAVSGSDGAKNETDSLMSAVAMLSTVALGWTAAGGVGRSGLQGMLTEFRTKAERSSMPMAEDFS